MDDNKVVIKILQFDPLRLELPTVKEGKRFSIVLPPVHVKVLDLSMGGLIEGNPHIGADAELFECYANFDEPVPVATMVEHIAGAADLYKKMWAHLQKGMDAADPLLD